MKRVSKEELAAIIERHGQWLRGEDGGERANLCGEDLREADLSGANMRWADLRGATMVGVDLSGANMAGANMAGANMTLARLVEATLFGANLTGADLRGGGDGADGHTWLAEGTPEEIREALVKAGYAVAK